MIWFVEAAVIVAAVALGRNDLLRYSAVFGIVLLLHTPLMAFYNLVAIAGIIVIVRRERCLLRIIRIIRDPLAIALMGLLLSLVLSTVLSREALPGVIYSASMRNLAGISAAGSLLFFASLDGDRRGWALAMTAGVLALGALRLSAEAGIDIHASFRAVMDWEPPGARLDYGSRNTLAAILNASLPVVLLVGRDRERRLIAGLRYIAVAVTIYIIVALQSRTATLVLVVSLATSSVLLVFRQPSSRRQLAFAVGCLLLAWLVRGVYERPLVLTQGVAPRAEAIGSIYVPRTAVAGVTGSTEEGDEVVGVEGREISDYLFRIALTNDFHALEQEIRLPRGTTSLLINARAPAESRGRLRILLDGDNYLLIQRCGPFCGEFHWHSFELPTGAADGGWHTITLKPEGDLSPVDSYYEVAGIRYAADEAVSWFLVHGRAVRGDISPDAGTQEGIGLVLPGDLPTLPSGRWLQPPGARPVLDQSLRDRWELWKIAWLHSMQRPVWGWGFYTFGHFFPALSIDRGFFEDYENAHSLYVELLHSGGFLALAVLVVALVVGAVLLYRVAVIRSSVEDAALAVSVAGFAINSLTQMTLIDQRYYALVLVSVGLLLVESGRSGHRPVDGHPS